MKKNMFARLARVSVPLLSLALTACGIGPKPKEPVGAYDFGLPGAAPALSVKGLHQVQVSAPVWMDGPALYYRLGYANAARPAAYAQTRWVAAPSHLIEARLRERAVAGGVLLGSSGPVLRIEIDEFTQVFDQEKKAAARCCVRAHR